MQSVIDDAFASHPSHARTVTLVVDTLHVLAATGCHKRGFRVWLQHTSRGVSLLASLGVQHGMRVVVSISMVFATRRKGATSYV